MQIYLAKPGGPRQGPYTLEHINADLVARKYRDEDFWAWHEGLSNWVPLYSIGGVSGVADTTFLFARPAPENTKATAEPPEPPGANTTIFLAKPPWLNTLQHVAEERETKIPVQPKPESTALSGTKPASTESRILAEPQHAEVAVCLAPTPVAKEPPPELNAPTLNTGKPPETVEPQAASCVATEPQKVVLMGTETTPGVVLPDGRSQPPEATLRVVLTSAVEEPPAGLSVATPALLPAAVDTKSLEPTATKPAKAVSSKRRAAASRRLFLLEGQISRRAGKSARPSKVPNRASTAARGQSSPTHRASALPTPWN